MSKINRLSELINNFGLKVCFFKGLEVLTRKMPLVKYPIRHLKYKTITKFLYDENYEIIKNFNNGHHSKSHIHNDYKVWVLWWQGIDQAPELVNVCINSMRKYIGEDRLVLLSKDNYEEYVKIPKKYVEMLNSEIISITQFSDLLRLHLLYQQGGVWLDSTYYLTDRITFDLTQYDFFSIHHCKSREVPVSHGLWAVSAIAFSRNNEVLKLILDIYSNYYSKRKVLVDYFLTDCIFSVCYVYCKEARMMFERVPVNNVGVDDLLVNINNKYDNTLYSAIVDKAAFHKLNWKVKMQKKDGKNLTLWGYIYEGSFK